MVNQISPTGYWISNDDDEHVFIPELSQAINDYVQQNNIKDVYDFGCGKGEYLDQLTKTYPHIEATGFEGYQTDVVFKNVVKLDLANILDLKPVDLVISIEVGEHIPKQFEQVFIDNISKSAKSHAIVSWAIEGQGGNGHVNCQNNEYIIDQMIKRGWVLDKETTDAIRYIMPPIWIQDTLMVFNKG